MQTGVRCLESMEKRGLILEHFFDGEYY